MADELRRVGVSVVTATRNRPVDMLRCALDGVVEQVDANAELIVVDDGSTSEHLEAIRLLRAELGNRIKLHERPAPDLPGTGPAAARNRGIAAAMRTYVAFCDDDDHWIKNDHLSVAADCMEAEQADLYFTNMQGENAGKVTIPDWFPDSPWLTRGRRVHDSPAVFEVALPDLMRTMRHHYPHPNGCVIRRSLLNELGGFWEAIPIAEDVDLVMRLADRARRILYRPDPVVGYNVTPRSSAFSRESAIARSLYCVSSSQHTRSLAQHGCVRRTARSTEAWHLREIADELRTAGGTAAARSFAWQAFAMYPALGTLRQLLR